MLHMGFNKNWPGASEEKLSAVECQTADARWLITAHTTLWADDKLIIFFLFFPENRLWHFMQIVSYNLHEMPNPIFWEKYFKMSSAEKFTTMLSVKPIRVVRRQRSLLERGDPIWQQSLEVLIVKMTVTDWLTRWLGKSGQKRKGQIKLRKGKTKPEKTHG